MDPKLKTALAVVTGVVIGVTLLGGAFATHAVIGNVAFGRGAVTQGYGMMGLRQGFDGARGMMGQRSESGTSESYGECPNGGAYSEAGCSRAGQGMMGQGGACQGAGQGMMGQRGGSQCGPQDGTGNCPNGGVCPNVTDGATAES